MKKRLLSILSLTLVMSMLMACGAPSKQETPAETEEAADDKGAGEEAEKENGDKLKIAVFLSGFEDVFYRQMMEAGDVAGEDYGVEIDWFSFDGSIDKEISLIDNAIVKNEYDGIILEPIDTSGIVPVVNKAADAGIKVICTGALVDGTDNISCVYPDREYFELEAEAICTLAGGKGTIAYIQGVVGNWTFEQRASGIKDAVAKFPGMKYEEQAIGNDSTKAQTFTETWINTVDDLAGIMCCNTNIPVISISAAQAMGDKADGILWGGIGAANESFPYIEDGTIVMDIMHGGCRVGYWNVAAMARALKGEEIPSVIAMSLVPVMSKETADKLADKGFVVEGYITPSESEVRAQQYQDEFGPQCPVENIIGNPPTED